MYIIVSPHRQETPWAGLCADDPATAARPSIPDVAAGVAGHWLVGLVAAAQTLPRARDLGLARVVGEAVVLAGRATALTVPRTLYLVYNGSMNKIWSNREYSHTFRTCRLWKHSTG